MYSYSGTVPGVVRYDAKNWLVPYGIAEITVGEGEEAIQQYRCQHLLVDHQPTDDDVRAAIVSRLNADVGAYIHAHYDAGTQSTLQALMVMESVPQAVKNDVLTIWPWIQSALAYYYGKKAEILSADDPKIITWDFAQFDASKPNVTLAGIMAAISA